MAKVQLGDHERKVNAVERVCDALIRGKQANASSIVRRDYPFVASAGKTRRYTPYQSCQVFIRDGFIDRYAGTRLIFPGALRALSIALPAEFPARPNWKMS